ncbi:MAG TPA: condensation domain-containing protein, partial [Polyangiaceae bacterium]|nr:condensation domain-containing protein [Polyangiaceae bacterium]
MTHAPSEAERLSERFLGLAPGARREFWRRLRERGLDSSLLPIPAGAAGAETTLSYAEERIWFLSRLEPDSPAYHMVAALRIRGELDTSRVSGALRALAVRHPALRTRYIERDGVAHRHISTEPEIEVITLHVPEPARRSEAALRALTQPAITKPFDLARDPLLRVVLARSGERECILILVIHHLVADGASLDILMREFASYYGGAISRHLDAAGCDPVRLPALPVTYADYAVFQRALFEAGELEELIASWREGFCVEPPALQLPADHPRSAESYGRGGQVQRTLRAKTWDRLRALARREGVTAFMLLIGAFAALLSRLSGEQRIVIGVPSGSRSRSEIEGVVGLFVNTLLVDLTLDDDDDFHRLFQRTKRAVLDAQSHRALPFEKIVETIAPERRLGQSPLFQAMFNYQSRTMHGLGLDLEMLRWGNGAAQLDLSLDTEDVDGTLFASFTYDASRFAAPRVELWADAWVALLESACRESGCSSVRACLPGSQERQLR